MADRNIVRAHNALKGINCAYTLYPVIGVGVEEGATVASGTGIWAGDAEIIAALAITTPFWICGCCIDTIITFQVTVVDIEIAGTTSVYSFRFDPSAVSSNVGSFFNLPVPRYIPANSQITARMSGAANTGRLNLSVLVATGY